MQMWVHHPGAGLGHSWRTGTPCPGCPLAQGSAGPCLEPSVGQEDPRSCRTGNPTNTELGCRDSSHCSCCRGDSRALHPRLEFIQGAPHTENWDVCFPHAWLSSLKQTQSSCAGSADVLLQEPPSQSTQTSPAADGHMK